MMQLVRWLTRTANQAQVTVGIGFKRAPLSVYPRFFSTRSTQVRETNHFVCFVFPDTQADDAVFLVM